MKRNGKQEKNVIFAFIAAEQKCPQAEQQINSRQNNNNT